MRPRPYVPCAVERVIVSCCQSVSLFQRMDMGNIHDSIVPCTCTAWDAGFVVSFLSEHDVFWKVAERVWSPPLVERLSGQLLGRERWCRLSGQEVWKNIGSDSVVVNLSRTFRGMQDGIRVPSYQRSPLWTFRSVVCNR